VVEKGVIKGKEKEVMSTYVQEIRSLPCEVTFLVCLAIDSYPSILDRTEQCSVRDMGSSFLEPCSTRDE